MCLPAPVALDPEDLPRVELRKEDEALERRRLQNRMAQRRFRRKQRLKKSAEKAQSEGNLTENDSPPPVLHAGHPHSYSHSPRAHAHAHLSPLQHLSPPMHHGTPVTLASGDPSHAVYLGMPMPHMIDDMRFPLDLDRVTCAVSLSDLSNCSSPPSMIASVPTAGPTAHNMLAYRNHAVPFPPTPEETDEDRSEGSATAGAHAHSHSHATASASAYRPGWMTPLHLAARQGHAEITRMLLTQHHRTDPGERDSDGLTALMHASAGGHVDVVQILLAHGARVGDMDMRGQSALHWAVLGRREDIVRALLAHLRDSPDEHGEAALVLDGYDEMGRTALHVAVEMGFEEGVKVLVDYGADLRCRARKV